jgi:hypothetical protein
MVFVFCFQGRCRGKDVAVKMLSSARLTALDDLKREAFTLA